MFVKHCLFILVAFIRTLGFIMLTVIQLWKGIRRELSFFIIKKFTPEAGNLVIFVIILKLSYKTNSIMHVELVRSPTNNKFYPR